MFRRKRSAFTTKAQPWSRASHRASRRSQSMVFASLPVRQKLVNACLPNRGAQAAVMAATSKAGRNR